LETKDTRFAVQEARYFLAVILKRAVILIPGNFAGKACVFIVTCVYIWYLTSWPTVLTSHAVSMTVIIMLLC